MRERPTRYYFGSLPINNYPSYIQSFEEEERPYHNSSRWLRDRLMAQRKQEKEPKRLKKIKEKRKEKMEEK